MNRAQNPISKNKLQMNIFILALVLSRLQNKDTVFSEHLLADLPHLDTFRNQFKQCMKFANINLQKIKRTA